jgi:putative SOS response-associated peptidase YedK
MCGRYVLFGPQSRYRQHFGVGNELDMPPRFNVAPSSVMPVIRAIDGQRVFLPAKWGLMPSWAKDGEDLPKPINAKAETAAIKPMFRHAFRKSRVLVPADAFYEWKAEQGGKQPYLIRMRDELPFGMGGLLEHWQGPEGELLSFAILTTEPNRLMAEIHNRMPVIVHPKDFGRWLAPAFDDVAELQGMIGPYPERLMEAYPVSRKVNSPGNDGPELLTPLS